MSAGFVGQLLHKLAVQLHMLVCTSKDVCIRVERNQASRPLIRLSRIEAHKPLAHRQGWFELIAEESFS
jgi:hypothetical protein